MPSACTAARSRPGLAPLAELQEPTTCSTCWEGDEGRGCLGRRCDRRRARARRGGAHRRCLHAGRASGSVTASASRSSSCSTMPRRDRHGRDRGRRCARARDRAVAGPVRGAGAARRAGMELAASGCSGPGGRRTDRRRPMPIRGPPRDWLARQLGLAARRRAGRSAALIELDPTEAWRHCPTVDADRRAVQAASDSRACRKSSRAAEHHHFAGASLAIRADVYAAVGGIDPLAALEDEAFAARLRAQGVPIVRPLDVRVRTSARPSGRASAGSPSTSTSRPGRARRRYDARDFDLATLAAPEGRRRRSA